MRPGRGPGGRHRRVRLLDSDRRRHGERRRLGTHVTVAFRFEPHLGDGSRLLVRGDAQPLCSGRRLRGGVHGGAKALERLDLDVRLRDRHNAEAVQRALVRRLAAGHRRLRLPGPRPLPFVDVVRHCVRPRRGGHGPADVNAYVPGCRPIRGSRLDRRVPELDLRNGGRFGREWTAEGRGQHPAWLGELLGRRELVLEREPGLEPRDRRGELDLLVPGVELSG